jgi:hypothetical protein
MPYTAQVHSTDTFGRMLCTARQHHFVSDGPASLGCPEEEEEERRDLRFAASGSRRRK